MSFAELWRELEPLGRDPETAGYRRYSWTPADAECRAWFTRQADRLGLTVEQDRNGNLWAWWGSRDAARQDAVVTGSHLDSVPDGGGYDGALGVASALAAVAELKAKNFNPERAMAIAVFTEEEGARFRVPCLGSRLMTGAIEPGSRPRPQRRRRDHAGRGDDGRGRRPQPARTRRRPARPDRRVRRTARRAGPRAGADGRGHRRGREHLAARAVALRLHRPCRPRGHGPPGRPERPDAALREHRAGRPPAGGGARRRGHVRQGHRRAGRGERGEFGRPGLAGRPRPGRGDAARRPSPRSVRPPADRGRASTA